MITRFPGLDEDPKIELSLVKIRLRDVQHILSFKPFKIVDCAERLHQRYTA